DVGESRVRVCRALDRTRTNTPGRNLPVAVEYPRHGFEPPFGPTPRAVPALVQCFGDPAHGMPVAAQPPDLRQNRLLGWVCSNVPPICRQSRPIRDVPHALALRTLVP